VAGSSGWGRKAHDFDLGEEAKLEDGGGKIEAAEVFGGVLGENVHAEVVEELVSSGWSAGERLSGWAERKP